MNVTSNHPSGHLTMIDVIEIEIIFGALELGIIPPGLGIDIEATLAGMQADEARATKRKFRKIKRQCNLTGRPVWAVVRDRGAKIMKKIQ